MNVEYYTKINGETPVKQYLYTLNDKFRAKSMWEIGLLEKYGIILYE